MVASGLGYALMPYSGIYREVEAGALSAVPLSWMQASRILAIAPDDAPVVLSLNGSALYLGVALGSVVGGEVLRAGSPADLGWVAALFPLIGLAIVLAARSQRPAAVAPAE